MDTPELVWKRFIEHLNKVQPLGRPDKEGKTPPHVSFIGSIASYRKVFLESQHREP